MLKPDPKTQNQDGNKLLLCSDAPNYSRSKSMAIVVFRPPVGTEDRRVACCWKLAVWAIAVLLSVDVVGGRGNSGRDWLLASLEARRFCREA